MYQARPSSINEKSLFQNNINFAKTKLKESASTPYLFGVDTSSKTQGRIRINFSKDTSKNTSINSERQGQYQNIKKTSTIFTADNSPSSKYENYSQKKFNPKFYLQTTQSDSESINDDTKSEISKKNKRINQIQEENVQEFIVKKVDMKKAQNKVQYATDTESHRPFTQRIDPIPKTRAETQRQQEKKPSDKQIIQQLEVQLKTAREDVDRRDAQLKEFQFQTKKSQEMIKDLNKKNNLLKTQNEVLKKQLQHEKEEKQKNKKQFQDFKHYNNLERQVIQRPLKNQIKQLQEQCQQLQKKCQRQHSVTDYFLTEITKYKEIAEKLDKDNYNLKNKNQQYSKKEQLLLKENNQLKARMQYLLKDAKLADFGEASRTRIKKEVEEEIRNDIEEQKARAGLNEKEPIKPKTSSQKAKPVPKEKKESK